MTSPSAIPPAPQAHRHQGRLMVTCFLVGALILAVVARLYWLQVDRYEHYVAKAEEQQRRVVVLDAPRGTIYDAKGRQLAVSIETHSIAAYPPGIEDKDAVAADLAAALGISEQRVRSRIDTDRGFVWIERKVDPARAQAVREMKLPGIDLMPESKRYYPFGGLAAQVLGYVGIDNHGLAGLEYRFDSTVAHEQGRRTVMLDGLNGRVLFPNLDQSEARPGDDLHLTLDASLQYLAERELAKAVRSSGAKSGHVLMLDPHTGGVLAMASYPTFDPNRFGEATAEQQRNRPVVDAYEPGSTFKMVTLAAALEAKAVDPLKVYFCGQGGIVLAGRRINDHKPFGDLTVRQILAKSSNVGAILLGQAAGIERFHSTIRAFGFGEATGIDLPGESAGQLRPLGSWSNLSPAYISFGQGVSITSLQLTNAFAAIANGGRLLEPYVVSSVGAAPGEKEPHRKVAGRPISPSSVRHIRSILEAVVTEGTAKRAALPGYRVAGKTGTAQKSIGGKGYAANRYIASFVGFAPVENPALAMAVMLDEPWPLYNGGQVAAPTVAAIAEPA
ncbi:MAG: penicillin-binding protein 2, partial [Acidobacteriota bacterium]